MESEAVLSYSKKGTLINLYKVPKEITVYSGGQEIIRTRDALLLEEKGRGPVYYYPLKDVKTEFLSPSDNHTFCPYKGEATYYNLKVGDRIFEDSVWQYRKHNEEFSILENYIAFYDKVVDRLEIS